MDFYKRIAPPPITESVQSLTDADKEKVEAVFRDHLSPNNWLGGCSFCGIEIMVPPSEVTSYAERHVLLLQDTKVISNYKLTAEEEGIFLAKSERVQLDLNVTRVVNTATGECTYLSLRTRYLSVGARLMPRGRI